MSVSGTEESARRLVQPQKWMRERTGGGKVRGNGGGSRVNAGRGFKREC